MIIKIVGFVSIGLEINRYMFMEYRELRRLYENIFRGEIFLVGFVVWLVE